MRRTSPETRSWPASGVDAAFQGEAILAQPAVIAAALAIVVGVLIEVLVMLLVVKVVNASRDWYTQGVPARYGERYEHE